MSVQTQSPILGGARAAPAGGGHWLALARARASRATHIVSDPAARIVSGACDSEF